MRLNCHNNSIRFGLVKLKIVSKQVVRASLLTILGVLCSNPSVTQVHRLFASILFKEYYSLIAKIQFLLTKKVANLFLR